MYIAQGSFGIRGLARGAVAVIVLLAATLKAHPATAQCTYTPLTSGTPVTVSTSPAHRSFAQGTSFWSGVGIRSLAGDNWDLGIYQATAAAPSCVSGLLGQSQMTADVDFVVGDFNTFTNPTGTYYVKAVHTSGTGSATVEWDDGSDLLQMNGPFLSQYSDGNDVLTVWDVYLEADVTYVFTFDSGALDMKFYIFENTASVPYWAGPGDAKKSATGGSLSYTPLTSGYHSVVAVNETGVAGYYALAVATCPQPTALTAGVSVASPLAENYYSIHQTVSYWSGVGVRAPGDWQVGAFQSIGIGLYNIADRNHSCLTDYLVSSTLPAPTVDFIVGDFNIENGGDYFINSYMENRQPYGSGTTEWDSGEDLVTVNAPTVNQAMGADAVLDVWDVFLEAGTEYTVGFGATNANMELCLMRETGTAWFSRADAEFTTTHNLTYVAPVEGYYGLVVVKEDDASGSYALSVSTGTVAVQGDIPTRSGLSGVMPNPTRGKLRIAYTLAREARASFEVLDISGRVVSRIDGETRKPGRWDVTWSGDAGNGGRAAPGVYFLRMRVDGRPVEDRKVIMLR